MTPKFLCKLALTFPQKHNMLNFFICSSISPEDPIPAVLSRVEEVAAAVLLRDRHFSFCLFRFCFVGSRREMGLGEKKC